MKKTSMKCFLRLTAFIALGLSLCACAGPEAPPEAPSPTPAAAEPAEPPEPEAPTETPPDTTTPKAPELPIEPIDIPAPESNPNLSLTEAEVVTTVRDLAVSAQAYYDDYAEQAEMITQNGFLFDFPSRTYLTTAILIDAAELDPKYTDETALILFVPKGDLADLGIELSVIAGSEELLIAAAYETADGFIIGNAAGDGGLVPKPDFTAFMSRYHNDHGSIARPSGLSQSYMDTEAALKAFRQSDEPLDMRYLAVDNKYAYAICSPKSDATKIEAYVLQNDAGAWSVKLNNFEKTYQSKALITEALPDFNMAMFPEYDTYYLVKYLRKDMGVFVDGLKEGGVVADSDGEPVFVSGTEDYAYITYSNGKKFIAKMTDGVWEAHPVANYIDAEAFMKESGIFPPLIIVKQN